jgi:zinc transport system substrate-binding protein
VRIILVYGFAASFLAIVLAGCGSQFGSSRGGQTKTVVAAFYPLAWAAEQIGGSSVDVHNLTPAGAEPHDIELTPREVAQIQHADVVLYLSHDFQPAVAEAVRDASGTTFDALKGQALTAGVGDESGKTDPHVWLDPVRFATIVERIGVTLGRPAAGRALASRIRRLDGEYRRGLAHCLRHEFVSSHAAFAYLAARYGLRMVAITGIDPDSEPAPKRLATLARLVRDDHLRTVFFERLVSPKLAQTVAREAHANTAVLDPIEGLTPAEAHAGVDYLALMRQNLHALRVELGCS